MLTAVLGLLKLMVLAPWYIFEARWSTNKEMTEIKNVGIMHIPCHANGGGEKVLWAVVNRLIEEKRYNISIYSDLIQDKAAMIEKVNKYFGYAIKPTDFNLVQLEDGWLTYSHHWKIFSRYLEGFAQTLVTIKALHQFMPDIYIETATLHFGAIGVKLMNHKVKVVTYVHYPYTDVSFVDGYWWRFKDFHKKWPERIFNLFKYFYHSGLHFLYRLTAFAHDVVFTNSSWTQNHMSDRQWGQLPKVLFPPCSVTEFWADNFETKKEVAISIGQFRSEKRHDVQLDMMKFHKTKHPESKLELHIIGSGKFEESELIYNKLLKRIEKEKIKNVKILKDLSFKDLQAEIKSASFGIHTMIDEHFGIAVVDMLAAGLVTIAHNSAGPKDDILGNKTDALRGFLANSDAEFNVTLNKVYEDWKTKEGKARLTALAEGAQNYVKQEMSNEAFGRKFYESIQRIESELREDVIKRQKEAKPSKQRKGEETEDL